MEDDVVRRLESHGQQPVPDIDPAFAQRLESKLRVEHVEQGPTSRRRARVLLPRLVVALVIVVVGLAGFAALDRNDPGVPVAVIDDDPADALESAATEGDDSADDVDNESDDADTTAAPESSDPGQDVADLSEPTATATPTPSGSSPVPAEPSPAATALPEPTVTSTPLPTAEPVATTPPTPSPPAPPTTAVPSPTATSAEATPVPTLVSPVAMPTPTATVEPTPTATPTPTPTASAEQEPVPIELGCTARVAGDAVGVVCEWTMAPVDVPVTSYELVRARNDNTASVVSRQRASAPTSYIDRDISPGDQVIYVVQGRTANGTVVAASVREIVAVPGSDS